MGRAREKRRPNNQVTTSKISADSFDSLEKFSTRRQIRKLTMDFGTADFKKISADSSATVEKYSARGTNDKIKNGGLLGG